MKEVSPAALLAHLSAIGDVEPPEAYLAESESDEPPLYTRLTNLAVLDGMSLDEKNRILFGAALLHADRVVNLAATSLSLARLERYCCIVTLMGWDGSEPIVPRFRVSTNAQEELRHFRLDEADSSAAKTTTRWLRELGREREFTVMEGPAPSEEPELFRVYVGHRLLPSPAMPTLQDIADRAD